VTVTSIASAASSSAASSGARATPAQMFDPAYALAYRFTVKIEGVQVGRWQSCSGLRVDFKPAEIKAGGRYDSVKYLPGEVSYPKVVLKRAVVASQSASLQDWLAAQARAWVNGETLTGTPVTITLYDSYGAAVLTWALTNARPSAWSGPDLDASASKVAIETLELVHEGFVVGAGATAPTGSTAHEAQLTVSDGKVGVVFRHPPTEIQVQRTQEPSTTLDRTLQNVHNEQSDASGQHIAMTRNKRDTTCYILNNLVIEGDGTRASVETLTLWATRIKTKTKGPPKETPVMPDITFSWGDGFKKVPVRLMQLSASYTRFSPTGKPIRAKVNLKLEEREVPPPPPPPPPPQAPRPGAANPGSGGIAGRSAHVLRAAESLHAVAQETYGSADRWRDIASANGVDDPLRVRPGMALFLPATAELDNSDGGGPEGAP
jgi:phage tail-like protein